MSPFSHPHYLNRVQHNFTQFLWVIMLILSLLITPKAQAKHYPAPETHAQALHIQSTTDEQSMKSLILDFQVLNPTATIHYEELDTVPLATNFVADYTEGKTADVIISSAMDLQIRLVNEGYAASHDMSHLTWLPEWTQWRQQAFGFTYEPAVMVYNKTQLAPDRIPQDRFKLIELLRDHKPFFQSKIGTYDIARSGFGYLMASQDAEQASTWARLSENLSQAKFKRYTSTRDMLEAVSSGELLLAYNVLGSYAQAALEHKPQLGIIFPADYTLVMSRVAFVSKRAKNPTMGHAFLDYLLSRRGQNLLANPAKLYPIHPEVKGEASWQGLKAATRERVPLKEIKLSPALLTYQDRMKKARFLQEWTKLLPIQH